jgi:hypothetical protein
MHSDKAVAAPYTAMKPYTAAPMYNKAQRRPIAIATHWFHCPAGDRMTRTYSTKDFSWQMSNAWLTLSALLNMVFISKR